MLLTQQNICFIINSKFKEQLVKKHRSYVEKNERYVIK